MQDQELFAKIGELVDEEKRLLNEGSLDEGQQRKLDSLGVQLDQCWDLLRQRRGARHAGANPADAHVRDPATVEHYQQ